MTGPNYHAWTHRPKEMGGTDPLPTVHAIYAIEVFEVDVPVEAGDEAFEWMIPEDLDKAILVKVEAYVNVSGSGTTIQIHNETIGQDLLSTPITINSGELNSKDATTQPVVNTTYEEVTWGDHLRIDVDAAGGAIGMGVILNFLPGALFNFTGSQGVQGVQGDPGGITSWEGQWTTSTSYTTNQAVSYNGSSYVARDDHTSGSTTEPGVGVDWDDFWMLLAEAPAVVAGFIASANDETQTTYTAVNTWEDIRGTSITWTAVAGAVYQVVMNMHWRQTSSNFIHHAIRCVVDGATTGVNPAQMWIAQLDVSTTVSTTFASAIAILDGHSAGSHTLKWQTNDGNTSADREICTTVVTLIRLA